MPARIPGPWVLNRDLGGSASGYVRHRAEQLLHPTPIGEELLAIYTAELERGRRDDVDVVVPCHGIAICIPARNNAG